jgi:hypothetical protein
MEVFWARTTLPPSIALLVFLKPLHKGRATAFIFYLLSPAMLSTNQHQTRCHPVCCQRRSFTNNLRLFQSRKSMPRYPRSKLCKPSSTALFPNGPRFRRSYMKRRFESTYQTTGLKSKQAQIDCVRISNTLTEQIHLKPQYRFECMNFRWQDTFPDSLRRAFRSRSLVLALQAFANPCVQLVARHSRAIVQRFAIFSLPTKFLQLSILAADDLIS